MMMPFCGNTRGMHQPPTISSPFKRPSPLRASSSRISSLPSIREECPTYGSVCSTPLNEQTEEFLGHQPSRSYTEESLGDETRQDSDEEELPPYVLLDEGVNKPAYSRTPSEATSSTTSVGHHQQQSSKLDGVLCPRCNLRRAKAWYQQIQKNKEPGSVLFLIYQWSRPSSMT